VSREEKTQGEQLKQHGDVNAEPDRVRFPRGDLR
jgi:hypothetical protein